MTEVPLRARRTPLLWLALLWLVVVDALNSVPGAFGVSLAGLLTLVGCGLGLLLIPAALAIRHLDSNAGWARGIEKPLAERLGHPWVPLPLALFGLWIGFRLVWNFSADGAQNVAVLLGFVTAIPVTAAASSPGSADVVVKGFRVVGALMGLVYLTALAKRGLGGDLIFTARAFGLAALIPIAVMVAAKRRWAPWLLTALVAASLSRTATAIAVMLIFGGIAVRGKRRGRLARVLIMATVGILAMWLLFTQYAPLRQRFIGGDNALTIDGLDLNTSGRWALWSYTSHAAAEAPIFGHGPGAVQALLLSQFYPITQPHSDYLRLLYDYGGIGAVLFVVGMLVLCAQTWRRARLTGHPVHWAAFLTLTAILAAALTTNVIVYPFVMVPAGVLVGASMAYSPKSPPDSNRDVVGDSRPRHDARASSHAMEERITDDQHVRESRTG